MIYNETRYNSQWSTKKLSQLGDFARGKSKHRPRNDERLFENGKYPLVQTGDIKAADLYITTHTQEYGDFGLQQSKLWDTGTLCITIAANIAETAILSYPMCFPDSVVGFTAYPAESSALFMHYVFTYIRNSIQKSTSGSIQDNINIDYLENLDFKIPIKDYQDKIVAVLGTIDKKIALNKRTNAELEAMAKTIYDYWFVQFDFPDENGKPYRTSGGEMEWNEQLKKDIPAGWSASKIKSFCTVTSGYPFDSGSYLTTGHYKLITIKNVQDDGINLDVDNFIETLPSNLPEYCKLKDSDILMSLTGNVGRVGLMYDNSCLLNQRVAIINPSKEAIRSYVYFLFKSDSLRMTMERIATGTSQKNLSPVDTELLNIPYDSIVAEKYSTIVDSAMKEMVLRLKENCELIRLRDWLLPMLMNGQATVE